MSASKLSDQFAALIAEYHRQYAARESLTSNGHRCSDLMIHNADAILAALRAQEANRGAVKAAVEAERETCAKIAEEEADRGAWDGFTRGCEAAAEIIAAAIRSRSSAPPVPAPIDEAAERRAFEEWWCLNRPITDRYDAVLPWARSAWLARARSEKE